MRLTYDDPLLAREEFLKGDSGVYRVEGKSVTGYKYVNCTSFFRNHHIFHTEKCKVLVEVPVGEYVVTADEYDGRSAINSRASGILIYTDKSQ